MIYSRFNSPNCPANIICFTGSDISNEMIEKCFKIDTNFFDERYLYDRKRVKSWVKKYSELCFVFYDLKKNEIIGYNFLVLLDYKVFEKYLAGELSYFTIGANQFVNDKKNVDAALLYLSSAYEPNANISQLMSMVQNAVTDLVISYKLEKNITIKNYFLDAVCQFDEKYCEAMKLKFYKKTTYDSKIYMAQFNPLTFFPKAVNYDILIKAYKLGK